MSGTCNLFAEWRVLLAGREGGRHVWTLFKSMDRGFLVGLSGRLSSSLALQPLVGLYVQRADRRRLRCFFSFKNHKIHLMRSLGLEAQ